MSKRLKIAENSYLFLVLPVAVQEQWVQQIYTEIVSENKWIQIFVNSMSILPVSIWMNFGEKFFFHHKKTRTKDQSQLEIWQKEKGGRE